MTKSPEAFRTISEAATELDLPQHVLRFWETKFPQIKPMKRGGGRRYYRRDDLELLAAIRDLLYERGYTIKGVQKLLKQQGVRRIAALGRDDAIEPLPPEEAPEEDVIVGNAAEPSTGTVVCTDDRELLNKVLLDLLGCKRVLDQAR